MREGVRPSGDRSFKEEEQQVSLLFLRSTLRVIQ